MQLPMTLALLGLATGCATVSPVAICEGTIEARDRLNVAVLVDGGDETVAAADELLARLDAGCRQ